MEAYTGFAEVYDRFMNNVPYDLWEETLAGLLAEYDVTEGLVLELGCGTGTMTERLAARGYDMIGVDLSEDMLAEALDKRCESGHNILYLNQDMREFELYGTVAAIYCICDSLNYITEREDLVQVFRLVNNYLDPGGVFIFDFNTPPEYESPLREAPIVEEQDGITMIWENEYDRGTRMNEHRVTFFLPVEEEPEPDWVEDHGQLRRADAPAHEGELLYQRIREVHEQRAYTLPEMTAVIKEAGMEFLTAFEAGTDRAPDADTHRVYCVARERGK
ncbi:MAG: class I SAM-dependent methyltransferase [Lachnospiraceae bacterium]|nr:class I SAM-dependent methyltransferase [Lachnospiraceae bacterium]